MYVWRLSGFWKDIGLPHDFLLATQIMLNNCKEQKNIDDFLIVNNTGSYKGINLVHKNVQVSEDALIGPYCVLHEKVQIASGCRLRKSVIMENTKIGKSSHVFNSILMYDIEVGKYVRIQNESILAEKVRVEDESFVNNMKINPGETVWK